MPITLPLPITLVGRNADTSASLSRTQGGPLPRAQLARGPPGYQRLPEPSPSARPPPSDSAGGTAPGGREDPSAHPRPRSLGATEPRTAFSRRFPLSSPQLHSSLPEPLIRHSSPRDHKTPAPAAAAEVPPSAFRVRGNVRFHWQSAGGAARSALGVM